MHLFVGCPPARMYKRRPTFLSSTFPKSNFYTYNNNRNSDSTKENSAPDDAFYGQKCNLGSESPPTPAVNSTASIPPLPVGGNSVPSSLQTTPYFPETFLIPVLRRASLEFVQKIYELVGRMMRILWGNSQGEGIRASFINQVIRAPSRPSRSRFSMTLILTFDPCRITTALALFSILLIICDLNSRTFS